MTTYKNFLPMLTDWNSNRKKNKFKTEIVMNQIQDSTDDAGVSAHLLYLCTLPGDGIPIQSQRLFEEVEIRTPPSLLGNVRLHFIDFN